jgi:hypothetical protein
MRFEKEFITGDRKILKAFLSIFIAAACVFYLRGVVFQGYLHPALFITLGLSVPLLIINRVNRSQCLLLFTSFACAIFVVFQYVNGTLKYGPINEIGRFAFPFFAAFVCLTYAKSSSASMSVVLVAVIILLITDSLYRICFVNNPTALFAADRYLIKGGGLLFMDSNFCAVIAGCVFLQLRNYLHNKQNIYMLGFLLLLVLLVSKSLGVWFSLGLVLLFQRQIVRTSSLAYVFVAAILVLLLITSATYSLLVGDFLGEIDASLFTKFKIVLDGLGALDGRLDRLFFGIGLGNLVEFTSWGSHNLFGLFVELGVIGFAILIFPLVMAWRDSSNRTTIAFLLIGGMSLFPMTYLSIVYLLLFTPKFKSTPRGEAYIDGYC